MKTLLLAVSGFLVPCGLRSADSTPPVFGGEKIGIPPLSLSEAARGAVTGGPKPFGTNPPGYAASPNASTAGPNVLSRQALNLDPSQRSRTTRGPSVSRESGMPVIIPGDAVDYKIVIVRPDPSIDPKMIVPLAGEPKPSANR